MVQRISSLSIIKPIVFILWTNILLGLFINRCYGFSLPRKADYFPRLDRWRAATGTSSMLFASTNDDFMASLRNRMEEVNDRETKLPLVVLDSMLPRQVLEFQCNNALLMELIAECLKKETPFFGMLGVARLRTGQHFHLKSGVEVEIVKSEAVGKGVRLKLKAGRRFTVQGEIEDAGKGWTEARVLFLDSEDQEEEEVQGDDRMAVARAIAKAKEFTSPNMNMEGKMSLVDRWVELAKNVEREPGQIDALLEQLGEIPPPEQPSERAFWVGALINPLPAMGVAMEIRPALLTAKTAEDRVQVAQEGILRSIRHMDGSARMF